MNSTTILFIIIFVVLIGLYMQKCEGFYIEPNTVEGGAMPQSGMVLDTDGQYQYYNAPLELEGPGDAAWSGY